MSGLKTLLTPITAPLRLLRSGVFALIYPAKIMSFKEAPRVPHITLDGEPTVFCDLQEDLKKDKDNPYKMDLVASMAIHGGGQKYQKNKQYIIHCDGNATCYEKQAYYVKETMMDENTDVILFNPPGVRDTPGATRGPEDYMQAIKCIVEHLREQGIPYENIVLSGRSLGGAMSAMVARDYQREGHRVKLFSDRSFAEMASAAGGFVKNQIPTGFLRATLGNALYYLVNGLVRVFGLNFSPLEAFQEINKLNPGDARCIAVRDDFIIPYEHSLYSNLPANQEKYRTMCTQINFFSVDPHNAPITALESESTQNSVLSEMKKNLKRYRKENRDPDKKIVHLASLMCSKITDILDKIFEIAKHDIQELDKEKLEHYKKQINTFDTKIKEYLMQIEAIKAQSTAIKPEVQTALDEACTWVDEIQPHIKDIRHKITQEQNRRSAWFKANWFRKVAPEPNHIAKDMQSIEKQHKDLVSTLGKLEYGPNYRRSIKI